SGHGPASTALRSEPQAARSRCQPALLDKVRAQPELRVHRGGSDRDTHDSRGSADQLDDSQRASRPFPAVPRDRHYHLHLLCHGGRAKTCCARPQILLDAGLGLERTRFLPGCCAAGGGGLDLGKQGDLRCCGFCGAPHRAH
ncbi:Catsper1, partial [Symbiodinium pilosum]